MAAKIVQQILQEGLQGWRLGARGAAAWAGTASGLALQVVHQILKVRLQVGQRAAGGRRTARQLLYEALQSGTEIRIAGLAAGCGRPGAARAGGALCLALGLLQCGKEVVHQLMHVLPDRLAAGNGSAAAVAAALLAGASRRRRRRQIDARLTERLLDGLHELSTAIMMVAMAGYRSRVRRGAAGCAGAAARGKGVG